MSDHATLERRVRQTGVFRCLECGKCTAVCPVSYHDHLFSPRRTVGRALTRQDEALTSDDRLWACLTCLHCSQVCPASVAYADLTLALRSEARRRGRRVTCTHGEVIHSWMRMMMDPSLKQDRLGWLRTGPLSELDEVYSSDASASRAVGEPPVLRVSEDSDTLYFVGCAPYFDVQFGQIGVDCGAAARATVLLLNHLGIEPRVLSDERCCGHDLLWEGDVDAFRTLAKLNVDLLQQAQAKRIVTACPECARALKVDYPAHGIPLNVEVLHWTELMAACKGEDWAQDQVPEGPSRRLTYHDPCRLGRHLGVYDAPRQVIKELAFDLAEMPRRRENALCCGTNGWMHCGAANQRIQANRLREAQATGADALVTACPKCQIHFRCAMQDRDLAKDLTFEIKDLAVLAAEVVSERSVR